MRRLISFFIVIIMALQAFGSWQEKARAKGLIYFADPQKDNYIFLFGLHQRGGIAKKPGFFVGRSLENYQNIINPLILAKSKEGLEIVFFCESYNNDPTDIKTAREKSGMINPISDYEMLKRNKVSLKLGGVDKRAECQSGLKNDWMERRHMYDTTFAKNTTGAINHYGSDWVLKNIKRLKIEKASVGKNFDNLQIFKYLGPVSVEFKYNRRRKIKNVMANLNPKRYYIFLFGSAHYHESVNHPDSPKKSKNILLLENSRDFAITTVNAYLADYVLESYYIHILSNDKENAPPPLEFKEWMDLLKCAKED